jgi:hypothetical protein
MSLYQEIIILQTFAPINCKWIIENVIPYYDFLIQPSMILGRHAIWTNFYIEEKSFNEINVCKQKNEREYLQKMHNVNLDQYKNIDKRKVLRNMVNSEIGKHILDCAFNFDKITQKNLFNDYLGKD